MKASTGLAAALTAGAGLALYSAGVVRRSERLVPRDGTLMEIDGHTLHVVDRGTGPAIVVIHGLGGQLRNFGYGLIDTLVAHHRIVLIDRPGSGYSPALTGNDIGIDAQARLVARLIDVLKLDRPLLVGHSYGGAVSLALALADPSLIRGIALIAPLSQHLPPLPPMLKTLIRAPLAVRLLMASTIGTPLGRLTQQRTLRTVFAPEPVPSDFAKRGGGALARRPRAIASAAGDLRNANAELASMISRYPSIAIPTAILFGRDDQVLDPSIHGERTAAAIAGSRFEIVAGGHMLPVTQPALTARFVEAAYRSSSG